MKDPALAQDAATKAYVDDNDAVDDAGNNPSNELQNLNSVLSLNDDAGNNKIMNLMDPALPQDAATKAYVDANNGGTVQGTDGYTFNIRTRNEGAVPGQARGENSVDLQTMREVDSEVAFGNFSAIGGGFANAASGDISTIAGGRRNYAMGNLSTIGGGFQNVASGDTTTIAGGFFNSTSGVASFIGGGIENRTEGLASVISGGQANIIDTMSIYSIISGGKSNIMSGSYSIIGGGISNQAVGDTSVILGGYFNSSFGNYSSIGGGRTNDTKGMFSTIAGGDSNIANGDTSVVAGGGFNNAEGNASSIGGGMLNKSRAAYSRISGGKSNYIDTTAFAGTISGGQSNTIDTLASYGTISGGFSNRIDSLAFYSTISGGNSNLIDSVAGYSTISGGSFNSIDSLSKYSTVSGGYKNIIKSLSSTIGGGSLNTASGDTSTIAGGKMNSTFGDFSTIGGGKNNTASGDLSSIPGGEHNLAASYGETVVGLFNVTSAGDASNIVMTDPVFVVGNGTADATRSNAMVVEKSGEVGIGTNDPQTKLHVDGMVTIGYENPIVSPPAGTIRWNDAIKVFEGFDGNSWKNLYTGDDVYESEKVTASDAEADDRFGNAVSVSGDYAIVGALNSDDVPNNSGSSYIFMRSGVDWIQQAKLTASDAGADDGFGISVAISGDYAIVGAYNDDDVASNSGSAYIFEKPVGGWVDMTQTAKLTEFVPVANAGFGYRVSIDGDYVIIGNRQEAAFIFEKPVGNWVDATETAKLTSSDGVTFDRFGFSVAISGDYAIVGAYGDNDGIQYQGSAYIFEKPVGGWVDANETAKLTASDAAFDDRFGRSVAISGDYAVVGADLDDVVATNSGSAYIFDKPVGSWVDATETAKVTASNAASSADFGCSVSLDGANVIVGANLAFTGGSRTGAAYRYELSGSNWNEVKILYGSDTTTGDTFGDSVSISGDYIIIGAQGNDDDGNSSGSAYFFKLN